MSQLPQHLLYQKGGTVSIDLPALPSSVTARIVDGSDSEQMAPVAATISTINTALAAAANVGNAQISVVANTGFAAGCVATLRDRQEAVLVKEVAGTTIYLRRPLHDDHIAGADVEGARVYAAVSATYANTLWWDGRCEWNIVWANSGTAYEYTAVECGRYPNSRMATAQDIYDYDPMWRPPRELDVERLLDIAHDKVLSEVAKRAPDQRARVFTGSTEFRRATAAMALHQFHLPRGGDAVDDWMAEFERAIAGVIVTTPRDADQDGTIEASERFSPRTVRLRR